MHYHDPIDQPQLKHALRKLQSYKQYLALIDTKYPPRSEAERRRWRRFRRCAQQFAAAARARDADEMNTWSIRAEEEMWKYLNRRRRR
jgi:hypothetical protein